MNAMTIIKEVTIMNVHDGLNSLIFIGILLITAIIAGIICLKFISSHKNVFSIPKDCLNGKSKDEITRIKKENYINNLKLASIYIVWIVVFLIYTFYFHAKYIQPRLEKESGFYEYIVEISDNIDFDKFNEKYVVIKKLDGSKWLIEDKEGLNFKDERPFIGRK